MKDTKRKKEIFLQKFEEARGIVVSACRAVGITRQNFYQWKQSDADFKQKVEEIEQAQIDQVEGALLQKINEGDTTAIIFYLKTKAKDRGYTERQEITGADGAPVQITGMVIK